MKNSILTEVQALREEKQTYQKSVENKKVQQNNSLCSDILDPLFRDVDHNSQDHSNRADHT